MKHCNCRRNGSKKAIIGSPLLSLTNQIKRKDEKEEARRRIAAVAAQESGEAIHLGVKT
jgi:hypothetical protein